MKARPQPRKARAQSGAGKRLSRKPSPGKAAKAPKHSKARESALAEGRIPENLAVNSSGPVQRAMDALGRWISEDKFGGGPKIVTHERVIGSTGASFFGLEFGITISEFNRVRDAQKGMEVVHVVNEDGSSNLETVLNRFPLGRSGQRLELQGPALNTTTEAGRLPLGARFVGVGLTGDIVDDQAGEAASYTAEVKVTEKSAADLALMVAPGIADELADVLAGTLGTEVGGALARSFAGAIPLVSGALALVTGRWAYKVLTDPKSSWADKANAVGHAVADTLRVVFPVTGALVNFGLVMARASQLWNQHRLARKASPPSAGADSESAGGGVPT